MNANPRISGIHHITAVASSAAENLAFYENVLGMRLVKQTVNFDDPYTYHLYYGDAEGSPGTILTFFPWENLPQGRPGTGMITAISLAVPRLSIDFWIQRIGSSGIGVKTDERFGDPVIQFADPHGLPVELIGVADPPPIAYWHKSPIADEHAVSGFHSATATLKSLEEIKTLLMDVMGLTLHDDPQAPTGRPGGGTVHHIAFRTDNDAAQSVWQSTLTKSGVGVTGVRDRKYFRSIYFHSPGGVLFEIATDPPGFTVDEPVEELGAALKLPEQYEPIRSDIEKRLPPLRSISFYHVFEDARPPADNGHTIVTLHGTGGNEHDLIGIARELTSTSAILSPRGKVLENGMSRFFRRLGNNLFDEADVNHRAHELSDFIIAAAAKYDRNPDQLTALGYSNGANIAAAIMLLRPEVFSSAVLLRPMLPLENTSIPDLRGKEILILKGDFDAIIPSGRTDRLAVLLQQAGAKVTVKTIDAGHEITARDLKVSSQWLSELPVHEENVFDETLMQQKV
jgi:predicted esterase/catechol 2,3-dioxygenase-like lactoylglutathione lyase family enzyme